MDGKIRKEDDENRKIKNRWENVWNVYETIWLWYLGVFMKWWLWYAYEMIRMLWDVLWYDIRDERHLKCPSCDPEKFQILPDCGVRPQLLHNTVWGYIQIHGLRNPIPLKFPQKHRDLSLFSNREWKTKMEARGYWWWTLLHRVWLWSRDVRGWKLYCAIWVGRRATHRPPRRPYKRFPPFRSRQRSCLASAPSVWTSGRWVV